MTLRHRAPIAICALLLTLFAALSWSSAEQESPTMDEPLGAMGGYVRGTLHDFRIDREDPPVMGVLAMLPHRAGEISLDTHSDLWQAIPSRNWLTNSWVIPQLFNTPANDGDRFVRRSRVPFLVVGVLLGALIAAWSWKLAGATAAVAATTLYSLDPNFIAHAPLVKNDVVTALGLLALAMTVWLLGQRVTWTRILSLCVTCAFSANSKFSGVMFIPFAGMALIPIISCANPWQFFHRSLARRSPRFLAAIAILAGASLFTYAATWTLYGFRFSPTPDPEIRLNIDDTAIVARRYAAMLRTGQAPASPQEIEQTPEPAIVPIVRFIQDHRLMPQAWCSGMLYTIVSAMARPTYLNGEYGWRGWWCYFPLAALYKTPLATHAALGLAMVIVVFRSPWKKPGWSWAIACLLIPAGLYGISAMTSNLNIGLRHILPVYPAMYVAIGVVAAKLVRSPGARVVMLVLLAALAGETLSAYPNYIPFFNRAVGGYRGGAKLLADSNIDWGQDVKRLVAWQREHPDVDLYIACVDAVDPRFYGLRFTPVVGNSNPASNLPPPNKSGVLAISVSLIQGTYGQTQRNELYAPFRDREPTEILGGSIYLYPMPINSRP